MLKINGFSEGDTVNEIVKLKPLGFRKEGQVMPEKNKCKKPENLKEEPKKCSPEQIRECHGEDGEHECAQDD